MQTVKDILEPSKEYNLVHDTYVANTNEFFDNLVKESKVDIEANKATCADIYQTESQIKKQQTKKKGAKVGKGFSIFFDVVGWILLILGILSLANVIKGWEKKIGIILTVVGAVVAIGFILIICLAINRSIKKSTEIINKLEKHLQEKTEEAWGQMEPLNSLFNWNIPQYLISSTVPLIELDRVFHPYRYWHLVDNYGFDPSHGNDETTLSVQSGEIKGNPFVFEKTFYTYMGTYTYTGSIVITWTTVERDSNGNSRTVAHTQTLTASLTKPKPYYDTSTSLIYGNEAAPDLCFERQPLGIDASKMSERKLARFVKKTGKKLDKKAAKAVKKGGTFVKMGNDEFEALFNCTDRTNETQYRLLFTPVAQQNQIHLVKNSPYHDDFSFIKDHMINFIHSEHSQNFEYHADPNIYITFDFEKTESIFKSYCEEYLQSLYFDLAPVLSIPLYQQHKPHDYIYKTNKNRSGVTIHEIESLCNYYGASNFAHPATDFEHGADVILKCKFTGKGKYADNASVTAYSYKGIPHTDLIPVYGGDGRWHNVPVHWIEFVPVSKSTNISALDIQAYEADKKKEVKDVKKELGFNRVYGQKGLLLSL